MNWKNSRLSETLNISQVKSAINKNDSTYASWQGS